MYGAIVGDIVGSAYEFDPTKEYNFEMFPPGTRFTDDTVLSVAIADVLMNGGDYVDAFHQYFDLEPKRGWGGHFAEWCMSKDREPYYSWGNGSAMRVSPIAWLYDDLEDVLRKSTESAAVTHNHPFGIQGAQSTAAAIFMARNGVSKDQIKHDIEELFNYDLDRDYEEIKKVYEFDVSCQGSVPEAIIVFLNSDSYEDCIRKTVALGGDADTQAAISGSIAEAFYGGIPADLKEGARSFLRGRVLEIADRFDEEFVQPKLSAKEIE